MNASAAVAHDPARLWISRWPTAVGVLAAVAALLAGPDRTTVGITVAIAALCYLTAAAFGRPWAAWAAIPGGSVLVVIGGLLGAEPVTTLGVAAGALVVLGLGVRAARGALAAEAVAALVCGGLVVLGLAIAPTAGLAIVAAALLSHAGWDVVHLRRRAVVAASLAEFCIALDVLLGGAILAGLAVSALS